MDAASRMRDAPARAKARETKLAGPALHKARELASERRTPYRSSERHSVRERRLDVIAYALYARGIATA